MIKKNVTMIFFLNTCSLGLNSCLKFYFNPFSITQNMYKILKHCTSEKIRMTVLKQHLCSFLFVILNSNFFSITQELKISMDMNFISLVLFFRFKRHTKKIYRDWKAGIYSLPFFYYNIFFETECNDYALINNTFKR